jgi:hypothetical protein
MKSNKKYLLWVTDQETNHSYWELGFWRDEGGLRKWSFANYYHDVGLIKVEKFFELPDNPDDFEKKLKSVKDWDIFNQ